MAGVEWRGNGLLLVRRICPATVLRRQHSGILRLFLSPKTVEIVLIFVYLFGLQVVIVYFLVYAGRYLMLFSRRLIDGTLRTWLRWWNCVLFQHGDREEYFIIVVAHAVLHVLFIRGELVSGLRSSWCSCWILAGASCIVQLSCDSEWHVILITELHLDVQNGLRRLPQGCLIERRMSSAQTFLLGSWSRRYSKR